MGGGWGNSGRSTATEEVLMLCVALGRAQGSLPFSLVPNTACKLRH